MNECTFVGRLTREWEQPQGANVYKNCIVVNKRIKGEDRPMFLDIEAWEKRGETMAQYLGKGDGIAVSGELLYQAWETEGQKRSKHVLNVGRFSFLPVSRETGPEDKRPPETQERPRYSGGGKAQPPAPAAITDDDIPF